MTPPETNGWPAHAIAIYERIAGLEARVEGLMERVGKLPCQEHTTKIAEHNVKVGWMSALFGSIGGGLVFLLAWLFRGGAKPQ